VEGVNVAGTAWVEIDFPFDLDCARRSVWPAIQKSLTARTGLATRSHCRSWRFSTLSGGAWTLSGMMGPASVDWETLKPENGITIRVAKADGRSRQWWVLRKNELLDVEAEGASPARLEMLPVLESANDTANFVIAVLLNGHSFRYEARRSHHDPGAGLPADPRLEGLPTAGRTRPRSIRSPKAATACRFSTSSVPRPLCSCEFASRNSSRPAF
jgi:hypothetical protein